MIEILCSLSEDKLLVTQSQAKVMHMFGLIFYDQTTEQFAAFAGVSKQALEIFLRIWGSE